MLLSLLLHEPDRSVDELDKNSDDERDDRLGADAAWEPLLFRDGEQLHGRDVSV